MESSKKNKSLAICIIFILVMMISILAVTVTLGEHGGEITATAEEGYVTVTKDTPTGATMSQAPDGYYWISTAGEFKQMMYGSSDATKKYRLKNNFKVTGSTWNNSQDFEFAGLLDGAKGDGTNYTIIFAPEDTDRTNTTASRGGLFGAISGTIQNLNFTFQGTLVALNETAQYGALAGNFSGTVKNSTLNVGGSITVAAGKEGVEEKSIYGGGLVGYVSGGSFINCDISVAGGINVKSYHNPDDPKSEDNENKNIKLYCGGIAGYCTNGNLLKDCTVEVSSSLSAIDSWMKSWYEIFESATKDSTIYPTGGIVGAAQQLSLVGNTMTISASINSVGSKNASKKGSITGGILGYIPTNGKFILESNIINISGGKLLPKSQRDDSTCYRGGIIGRAEGAIGGNFSHNVFNFTTDDSYYNFESNLETDSVTEHRGMLIGYGKGAFASWNSGNNWFMGISQKDFEDKVHTFAEDSKELSSAGTFHKMIVMGGGKVEPSIDEVSGNVSFSAKAVSSPFYAWLTSLSNKTGQTGTTYSKVSASPLTIFATFLTLEISSGGELVQFANEMNDGLNQNWIEVHLTGDVAVEKGTPVINEFTGRFFGDGHTISYYSSSSIVGNSHAGIFGTLANSAHVENLNIEFAGDVNVVPDEKTPEKVYAGALAGINHGEIKFVRLNLTQSANVNILGAKTAIAGGLVGFNDGIITKCKVDVQGKVNAQGSTTAISSAVIGESSANVKTYEGFNVNVDGEIKSEGSGSKIIGAFIGNLLLSNTTFCEMKSVVISVSDYGNFRTLTLNGDNSTAIGVFGQTVDGVRNASFSNSWLIASYEQYVRYSASTNDLNDTEASASVPLYVFAKDKDEDVSVLSLAGLNRLYVEGGTAYCTMFEEGVINQYTSTTVYITIPKNEGRVFTGWFTKYDASEVVPEAWHHGAELNTGNQTNLTVFTKIIGSTLMTPQDMMLLSSSTNLGQDYSGIEFRLGADVVLNNWIPIGTEANPFNGTFDGKGHTLTITSNVDEIYGGVFGCLSTDGVVKQLTVDVEGEIGSTYVGAVVAYNYGQIGMDSSTFKVTVNVRNKMMGNVVGSVTALNAGVVKNVEVNVINHSDTSDAGEIVSSPINEDALNEISFISCGGVAGINYGTLKNALVNYDLDFNGDEGEGVIGNLTMSSDASVAHGVGGLVGLNFKEIFSSVVHTTLEIFLYNDLDLNEINGGLLVGYNDEFADEVLIDSLWLVYNLKDASPEIEDPTPLINGQFDKFGNVLIRYGGDPEKASTGNDGNLLIAIEDNNSTQPLGGSIRFTADEDSTPFYNFISDFSLGTIVTSDEGYSGQNFNPTVATTRVDGSIKYGLQGHKDYAVFVKSQINSTTDLYNMAKNINSGFEVYVNYILDLGTSTVLRIHSDDELKTLIGAGDAVFNGSFNGNGKMIEVTVNDISNLVNPSNATVGNDISQAQRFVGLFGNVGENSVIHNFDYHILAGVVLDQGIVFASNDEQAMGFVAHVNKGTIKTINMQVLGTIRGGVEDSVGTIAGYNSGTISDVVVTLKNDNTLYDSNFKATLFGKNVGAVCGYNVGTIGSQFNDGVIVNMSSGVVSNYDNDSTNLVGFQAVGGISGVNDGTVLNVSVSLNGKITTVFNKSQWVHVDSTNLSLVSSPDVGGIVGVNNNNVYGCSVTFGTSSVWNVQGNLGGVAGTNYGVIGASSSQSKITVILNRNIPSSFSGAISNHVPENFGGIAGVNVGELADGEKFGLIENATVLQNATIQVSASGSAGGIVGVNSGFVSKVTYTLSEGYGLIGKTVGGIAGTNFGSDTNAVASIEFAEAIIEGTLGNANTMHVGGIAGTNYYSSYQYGRIDYSLVMLHKAMEGEQQGLVTAISGANAGKQTWAYCNNRITTEVCYGESQKSEAVKSGFNFVKMVGDRTMNYTISYSPFAINFVSQRYANDTVNWYVDISKGTRLPNFEDTNEFSPTPDKVNCNYHVCYYDLRISSSEQLLEMCQYINAYDFFTGVLFTLEMDLTVESTLQPIGTQKSPFTAIFDGQQHTITFQPGSGIAGTDYSGLFGYLAETSIVRNLVLDIREDVIVGSGAKKHSGALAGQIDGTLTNVAINLRSAPYSTIASATVGAVAGYVSDTASFENVWVVVYNQGAEIVGAHNFDNDSKLNVNYLGILGGGKVDVDFAEEESDVENLYPFNIYIDKEEGEANGYFTSFGGWYSDITNRVKIDGITEYGVVSSDKTNSNVSFLPEFGRNFKIVMSFIKLDITSTQEFYEFVENINTYGDQNASFELLKDIEVDCELTTSVGTPEHKFTGIFNGNGKTITLNGDMIKDASRYSGLFGYVGQAGIVKNLVVKAGTTQYVDDSGNLATRGQKVGDKTSIYSGYLVARLDGSVYNVVTIFGNDTEIYNVNPYSRGGLIGVMDCHAFTYDTWLVIPEENTSLTQNDGRIKTVGEVANCAEDCVSSHFLPNVMRISGEGEMNISLKSATGSFSNVSRENIYTVFLARRLDQENAANLYGIIDNDTDFGEADTATLLNNSAGSYTTLGKGALNNVDYVTIFLDTTINSYHDLQVVAQNVNSGRNYKGVIYSQTAAEIVIDNDDYIPIGGQVAQNSENLSTELYTIIEFMGTYNGNGNTIVIDEDVVINARYAGIFGVLGETAKVRNLKIKVRGTLGVVTDNYVTSTLYAGPLAGENRGATIKNVIVQLETTSKINAIIGAGRFCGNNLYSEVVENGILTGYEGVSDMENCWVVTYNSKFDALANESENAFHKSVSNAIAEGTPNAVLEGVNNGGVNVVTVIAAGEISVNFLKGNAQNKYDVVLKKEWGASALNWTDYASGEKPSEISKEGNTDDVIFVSNQLKGSIWQASFLKAEINSYQDLVDLASATNDGYDLYGLVFTLSTDIEIQTNFYVAIGNDVGKFNATFDGQGHTISLASGYTIAGKYAGVFGNLDTEATIKNLKFRLDGTLGKTNYKDEEIADGAQATLYAGAIAYTTGRTESIIVYDDGVKLSYLSYDIQNNKGYGGIAIGYDVNNLVTNSWAILSSDSTISAVGGVSNLIGNSAINSLRVIGPGKIIANYFFEELASEEALLESATSSEEIAEIEERISALKGVQNTTGFLTEFDQYFIVLKNDTSIDDNYVIKGWYSDYESDSQLSNALQIGNFYGYNQYYATTKDILNKKYEVVSMSTVITSVEQLTSIAKDVNEGGYSYSNITFSLGKDLVITNEDGFTPIGTENSPFCGIFEGRYRGGYHSITLDNKKSLFGVVNGTIDNLVVVVAQNIQADHEMGALATINNGKISGCMVVVKSGITVKGNTAGAMVGDNHGTISDSMVILQSDAQILGNEYAGAISGINSGDIIGTTDWNNNDIWEKKTEIVESYIAEDGLLVWNRLTNAKTSEYERKVLYANVIIAGTIKAESETADMVSAGGITGYTYGSASIDCMTVRVVALDEGGEKGEIIANGIRANAGGMVGRSNAMISNSVIINQGTVSASNNVTSTNSYAYAGSFAGDITGSAINSWVVSDMTDNSQAIGNGVTTHNELKISGNGKIEVMIDQGHNVIFGNVTADGGAELDGWYYGNNIKINDGDLGNVDTQSETYIPKSTITGRVIKVVFINTELRTVEDLKAMAVAVNNGLSAGDIVFTLQNNITIHGADWADYCIGSDAEGYYGFKHAFDGKGYTITFTDTLSENFKGLFGYITRDGIVRNVNVVYDASTITHLYSRFGGIAYFSAGEIDNVSVTFKQDIKAEQLGGISAVNSGIISNSEVVVGGDVSVMLSGYATAQANASVGGIVGTNASNGLISNVKVLIKADSSLNARAVSGTAYSGGVAGLNTGRVYLADVQIRGVIVAESQGSAYSGGVIGNSSGSCTRVFVTVADRGMIGGATNNLSGYSGGIVGNNMYQVRDSVILVSATARILESGIGFAGSKSDIGNVWVINYNVAHNSKCAYVNNLTINTDAVENYTLCGVPVYGLSKDVAGNPAFDYLKEKVLIADANQEVVISFNIPLNVNLGTMMFADTSVEGSDVVVSNLSYKIIESTVYLTYTSTADLQGVSISGVCRNSFASESELAMVSFAYSQGQDIPTLTGFEYSLRKDITITQGFAPIGTSTYPIPANVIFNGTYKSVIVDKNADYVALFGYSKALIKELIVRVEKSITGDNTSAVCIENRESGKLDKVFVYNESNVQIDHVFNFIGAEKNDSTNCWYITTNDKAVAGVGYKVLIVNGDGKIVIQQNQSELTPSVLLVAVSGSDSVVFAGFSTDGQLIPDSLSLDTSKLENHLYTAEFINNVFDDYQDFKVLDRLLSMGFDTEDKIFSLGADVIVESTDDLIGICNPLATQFKGIFDGKGYRMTVKGGSKTLFGGAIGEITNLIINLYDLEEESTLRIFDELANATLSKVIIEDKRSNSTLGSNALYIENSFVVTDDFNITTSSALGIIKTDSKESLQFTFNSNNVEVTALETENNYFAGWYNKAGEFVSANHNYSLEDDGDCYLKCVSSFLENEKDFITLDEAVSNGIDFEGYTFDFISSVTLNEFVTIGGNNHSFAGVIKGDGQATITINHANAPLFDNLAGSLVDLHVAVSENAYANDYNSTILANSVSGSIQSVSVTQLYSSHPLYTECTGSVSDSWIIVSDPEYSANLSDFDVLVASDEVSVSFNNGMARREDTSLQVSISAENPDKFLVWTVGGKVFYNMDYAGISTTNADLLKLKSEKGTEHLVISVNAINVISNVDEYSYFAVAVANGFGTVDTQISLGENLVLSDDTASSVGFKGTFDGQGKTIDLSNLTVGKVLFRALEGKVENLIVNANTLAGIAVGINDQSGHVENSVLSIFGNVYVTGHTDNVNLWLLSDSDKWQNSNENADWYWPSVANGLLNYDVNGKVAIAIDLEGNQINFNAEDSDKLLFAGYHNVDADSYIVENTYTAKLATGESAIISGKYVPSEIHNLEDWNKVAFGIDVINMKTDGKTIRLLNDLVVEDIESFQTWNIFYGIFEADYHKITFKTAYNKANPVVCAADNGKINNLALEIYADPEKVVLEFAENNVVNSWAILYCEVGDENLLGNVRKLYVGGNGNYGSVQTSKFEDDFLFTANPNYANFYDAYQWKNLPYTETAGEPPLNENCTDIYNYATSRESEDVNGNIQLVFKQRFAITVNLVGVNMDNEESVPSIKINGVETLEIKVWKDVALSEVTIQYASSNAKSGNLFLGFFINDLAVGSDDIRTIALAVASLSGDVVIEARFQKLSLAWQSQTYNASVFRSAVDLSVIQESYREHLDAVIDYEPLNEDGPGVVVEGGEKGVMHVGTYKVIYTIYYYPTVGDKSVRYPVGNGVSYIEITPATLYFENLTIKNKIYDSTTSAEVYEGGSSYYLVGFMGSDSLADLDLSGIKFRFLSSDAGQDIAVKVAEDSVLKPSGSSYAYINYVLDDSLGIRNQATNKLVTGTITRRKLVLTAEEVRVDYLDQFKPDFNATISAKVKDSEGNILFDADKAEFDQLSASIMSRVDANNKNVGEYPIIVANEYVHRNYDIVLSKDSTACYVITATPIEVVAQRSATVYGDKIANFGFHIHSGENIGKACVVENGDCVYDTQVLIPEAFAYAPLSFAHNFYTLEGKVEIQNSVDFVPGTAYGVKVTYLASNVNYALYNAKDLEYLYIDSEKVYVMYFDNAFDSQDNNGVLQVSKRDLIVSATQSGNTKQFGAKDGKYTYTNESDDNLVGNHVLGMVRESGELAGEYQLYFKAYAGEVDVTDTYYNIKHANGIGYTYVITKTKVTIGLNGSYVNHIYGDLDSLSDMVYTTSFASGVTMENLYSIIKPSGNVKNGFSGLGIKVVMKAKDGGLLDVGSYKAILETDAGIYADSIEFVLNTSANTFYIKPRTVNVTLPQIEKFYDGTPTLPNELTFNVAKDGILEDDKAAVKVVADQDDFYRVNNATSSAALTYSYSVRCRLENMGSANKAQNYLIKVTNGNFVIKPLVVNINVLLGYFAADGSFTPADNNSIYFGDCKASFYYDVENINDILVSFGYDVEAVSDQVKQEYLISVLNIRNTLTLETFVPGKYDATALNKYVKVVNSNAKVTLGGEVIVEGVTLILDDVVVISKDGGEPELKEYTIYVEKGGEDITELYHSRLEKGRFEFGAMQKVDDEGYALAVITISVNGSEFIELKKSPLYSSFDNYTTDIQVDEDGEPLYESSLDAYFDVTDVESTFWEKFANDWRYWAVAAAIGAVILIIIIVLVVVLSHRHKLKAAAARAVEDEEEDDEEEEAETEAEEEITIPEVLKEFNLEIEGPTAEIEEREEE